MCLSHVHSSNYMCLDVEHMSPTHIILLNYVISQIINGEVCHGPCPYLAS